jgi:hypothetical protein
MEFRKQKTKCEITAGSRGFMKIRQRPVALGIRGARILEGSKQIFELLFKAY